MWGIDYQLKICIITSIACAVSCDFLVPLEASPVYYRHHGYALISHLIQSLNRFFADCLEACEDTVRCFSFNYIAFPNGTFVCELSNSTKNQNPRSYVRKEGYQYAEPSVRMLDKITQLDQKKKFCKNGNCFTQEALPNGWYRLGASSYKLMNSIEKTWTDARQYCQSQGGELLSLSNELEVNFVTSMFEVETDHRRYIMDGSDNDDFSLYNGAKSIGAGNTKGIYFDGVNDYAEIPKFDLRGKDFTIAIRVKINKDASTSLPILNDEQNGHAYSSIKYFLKNGALVFLLRYDTTQGNNVFLLYYGSFPTGRWVHTAITWNRKTRLSKLFVDGKLVRNKTSIAPNIEPLDNSIKSFQLGRSTPLGGKYFRGKMRDLVIFTKELSPKMIIKLKERSMHPKGIWIGLNDITAEGTFKWSDGTPLTSMPSIISNNDVRDCVLLRKLAENSVEWWAGECEKRIHFICEKE